MEKRWTTSRTDGNGTPEELWSSCDGVRLQLRLALSLGLLVSYATLARLLQICCGALDLGGSGDAGRIKRSSVIARIRSLRGKRKPELLSRFRRH